MSTTSDSAQSVRNFCYLTIGSIALWIDGPGWLVMVAMGVTALSAVHRTTSGIRSGRLQPIVLWEIGFIWVLLPEWIMDRAMASRNFGDEALHTALGLLIAGHCVVVLVTDWRSRPGRIAKALSSDREVVAGGARVPLVGLVGIAVGALIFWVPPVVASGLAGRSASIDGVGSGALGTIVLGAGLLTPTLIAQRILTSRNRSILLGVLLSSPFVLAAAASGTRFYLLFAVVGPVGLYLFQSRLTTRQVVGVGVGAAIIVAATSAMLEVRQGGLATATLDKGPFHGVLHSEGVIVSDASLVDYFDNAQKRDGRSVLAVLVSPIPRVFWPEKPTLLGYWLPRARGVTVSAAHSNSYGFIGEGYSDFGTLGVLAESTAIGLILGGLQRYVLMRRSESLTGVLMSALSYPICFFAVRSPVTTLVVASVMLLFIASLEILRRTEDVLARRSGFATRRSKGKEDRVWS